MSPARLYDAMIDPFLRPRTSGDGSKARLFHWSKMDPRRMSCHQISKKTNQLWNLFFFFFGFWFSLSCISFLTHESASTTKHSRPSEPWDQSAANAKLEMLWRFEAKQLGRKPMPKSVSSSLDNSTCHSCLIFVCCWISWIVCFFLIGKSEKSCEIRCTFT